MEEVGRKLYLSETPSIGWEAKTLGAKRRISSSEIATVPGAAFSAVLMLVDFVSWFSEPQQRGEVLGAAGVFSRRSVSVEKVCWAYFSSRKRSVSRATHGRRSGSARAASEARRVEDLNGRGLARNQTGKAAV